MSLERGARTRGREVGQVMAEMAVVFPLLLVVAVGLVQFALYAHAQNVVTGAVQDGARIAAEDGRTAADGVAYARSLLAAGMGNLSQGVSAQGAEEGDVVILQAQGKVPTIIPWVGGGALPLSARAVVRKERFHAGPGN